MRIIIIEPEFDGHYIITYVKFVIEKLLSHKIQVILITSDKARNHLALKIIQKAYPKIKVKFLHFIISKASIKFFSDMNI